MRISDWSSDVCSSDLSGRRCPAAGAAHSFAPPIRWERRASGQVRGVWSSNSYSMQSDSAPKRDIRIIPDRSEEHTSELQSLMRISYAVFCLKKKKHT